MRLTKLFTEFFDSEKTGGFILIFVTILSLLLANVVIGADYADFWEITLAGKSLSHWINDGLMAVFFLLIGLELKKEIFDGELADIRSASLPIIAALGGMVVPLILYYIFTIGTEFTSGAGIPMATDIAFAVGILSLLGKKVPTSLKVFLTALAVIDDLGAILIIALFYGGALSYFHLLFALIAFGVLFGMNKMKVKILFPYLVVGVVLWYFMLHSGIHATIAGVLLAFVIPFGNGNKNSASYRLQHFLHKPVAYFILPLFAMANTAILIKGDFVSTISELYSLGIFFGLYLGKPIGILLFCFVAVKSKIAKLPAESGWDQVLGAGILAGIGFTMSIFITLLAFDDQEIIDNAKLMIMLTSLMAAITGYFVLAKVLNKRIN